MRMPVIRAAALMLPWMFPILLGGCPDNKGAGESAPEAHPLLIAKCQAGTKAACDELQQKCDDGDETACSAKASIRQNKSRAMPNPGGTDAPATAPPSGSSAPSP